MQEVNHAQLQEHLLIAWNKKTPIYLHGVSGIGKSQAVRAFSMALAKSLKLEFTENGKEGEKFLNHRDVRLAQLEDIDMRGGICIDKEKGVTSWIPCEWLPRDPEGHYVLFFDEANRAMPSVLNAGLELFLDRRLGNYKLPKNCLIVLAGNPNDSQYQVNQMNAAVRNRFKHFYLNVPTIDEWTKWSIDNGILPSIVSFLHFKREYLYKLDEDNRDASFPSPRAWEITSKSIADLTDMKVIEREVASAVGRGVAIEFSSFLKLQEKVDLDEIIKNPESVRRIKETSLKYAVVGGLSERYKADKKSLEQLLNVCNFLEPEFGFILFSYLRKIDKMAFGKMVTTKIWKELAPKYGKYLPDN